MKLKRIGVDLAKNVFQIHGVDSHEQARMKKQTRFKSGYHSDTVIARCLSLNAFN